MGYIKDNMAKLRCSVCKRVTYYSKRNKKKVKEKLELRKFCRYCGKHQKHTEAK